MRTTAIALSLIVIVIVTATRPVAAATPPGIPRAIAEPGVALLPAGAMPSVKDFGAVGDGVSDDTAAIQRALNDGRRDAGGNALHADYFGRPKALYFPPGVYLVSNTLDWIGCCVTLQGAGSARTVIKLKDATAGFGDPAQPRPLIRTPAGNMSFRQNVRDLTLDSGRGNPGAVGLDYIANNSGAVTDVVIRSGDGRGSAGLDLTRQWPGPALFRRLQIEGFDRGISVRHAEYGPTFEQLVLRDQRVAGISNEGNILAIRGLDSRNTVPAIISAGAASALILLDADLRGGGSAHAAVESEGHVYARNLTASGYRAALRVKGADVPGLTIAEHVGERVFTLFDSPARTLRLPVAETPEPPDDNPAGWARFTPARYGDTAGLQALLDAGAATVYFPFGVYFSFNERAVTVPAGVRRIVGFSSVVNGDAAGTNGGGIRLIVTGDSPTPLIIEQFGYGMKVEHRGRRPVVLRSGGFDYSALAGAGNLFLEDVEVGPLNLVAGQRVWARQLNNEYGGTKITNPGGDLWMLGLKTERAGTVIETTAGGRSELLGTLIYPSRAFSDAEQARAAFISSDASLSLIYAESVYCAGCGYPIHVEERRGAVSRTLPAAGLPRVMPLFAGFVVPAAPGRPPAGALTAAQTSRGALLFAEAADPDGNVVSVEFFRGDELLGVDRAAPYCLRLPGRLAAGEHRFTARITDDSGSFLTSAPASLHIGDEGRWRSWLPLVMGGAGSTGGGGSGGESAATVSAVELCATP